MTKAITNAIAQLEQDYVARTPGSREIISEAAKVLPSGETRTTLYFAPYPLVMDSAKGSQLTDVDGNVYRDFLNDYSAGLYGHSQPLIQAAISEVVSQGLTLGGVNRYESQLAKLLVDRFPALDKIRFTNSGSEADMMAIATARAYTGRDKLLVMAGGYHGQAVCIAPQFERTNAPFEFVVGAFNDLEKTEQAVAESGGDLAAILVEPMLGAGGAIPADKSFLQGLRDIADRTGALLIFDEVMTSRTGPSGAQGHYGVIPDLMACGKFLGGGGNFGAFGGREDIMSLFDSDRSDAIMHGGTFNNNVITMAAGLTGLRDIYTPEKATEFYDVGVQLRDDINALIKDKGVKMQTTGLGTITAFHHHTQEVRGIEQYPLNNPESGVLLHMALLERGIYIARRGYTSLSLALNKEDYDAFMTALADVLDSYGEVFNEAALA